MPTTSTAVPTLKDVLTKADPDNIADALRKVDLGNMLQAKEWDSGVITAAAAILLPEGALAIQSVHVISSGTAASVGHYLPGNSASTPLLPPGGANTAVGICSVQGIAAPGAGLTGVGTITGVTLPNTVTRVVVRYIAAPKNALLTDRFAPGAV
jgi:hypothetical protein